MIETQVDPVLLVLLHLALVITESVQQVESAIRMLLPIRPIYSIWSTSVKHQMLIQVSSNR